MKNVGIIILIVVIVIGIIWFATRSLGLRDDAALARQQEQSQAAQQQTHPLPHR